LKIATTVAGLVAFVLLVTANGAGYRYGISDQAAYVPVVMLAENPAAFPHDAPLLATQGQFFFFDDAMGAIARTTGASIESMFLWAYLLATAGVWLGVMAIGKQLYPSVWLTIAFGALVTLRHHIPRTSVNSLEPYFQSRVVALGIGMLAVAMFLRRRHVLAVVLVGIAGAFHPTTALWFSVLLGTALSVVDQRWRIPALVTVAIAMVVLLWAMVAATRMDPLWIEALGGRDFIFPSDWPFWAWAANLALLAALWVAHTVRRRRGTATAYDAGLVWGATALVAVFLVTLPAVARHVALAVQFQFSRVFWLVDLLLAMYAIAAIGERLRPSQARVLALVLVAIATARGVYVMTGEHAERRLFQLSLADSPWTDAMRWLSRQPVDVHVLADPGHAFKYGVSVRVAAGRDVLLEDDKDAAIALYSRAIAERVVDRRGALQDFPSLTAAQARTLAERYDLDYAVTETVLALPEVYRNSRFRIYALKRGGPES